MFDSILTLISRHPIVSVGVILIVFKLWTWFKNRDRERCLRNVPGNPRLPIIGNLHDLWKFKLPITESLLLLVSEHFVKYKSKSLIKL